jgi:uncharacterized membrane protein YqjE
MALTQNKSHDGTQGSTQDKSLGQLIGDLTREMSTLVRQEVQLAKTEITEKVSSAVRGSALLIVSAVFGFVAFEALVAAAILALAQSLSAPLAALIVGAVLLLIAGVAAIIGLGSLKKGMTPPQQTIDTIKDDVKWAKEQL